MRPLGFTPDSKEGRLDETSKWDDMATEICASIACWTLAVFPKLIGRGTETQ
jgi:hypothetical protein